MTDPTEQEKQQAVDEVQRQMDVLREIFDQDWPHDDKDAILAILDQARRQIVELGAYLNARPYIECQEFELIKEIAGNVEEMFERIQESDSTKLPGSQ